MSGHLTLFDVADYRDGWARNGPPAYITQAAMAGWKPQKEQNDDQRFDDLMRMLGGS